MGFYLLGTDSLENGITFFNLHFIDDSKHVKGFQLCMCIVYVNYLNERYLRLRETLGVTDVKLYVLSER